MTTGMPELGSKISLISKADIRYEGRLYTVDPQECTIALSNVRSFGTEDRDTQYQIAPQSQIYDYILFRGSDIKDIRVVNNSLPHPNDPAIMQVQLPNGQHLMPHFSMQNMNPPHTGGIGASGFGNPFGAMAGLGNIGNGTSTSGVAASLAPGSSGSSSVPSFIVGNNHQQQLQQQNLQQKQQKQPSEFNHQDMHNNSSQLQNEHEQQQQQEAQHHLQNPEKEPPQQKTSSSNKQPLSPTPPLQEQEKLDESHLLTLTMPNVQQNSQSQSEAIKPIEIDTGNLINSPNFHNRLLNGNSNAQETLNHMTQRIHSPLPQTISKSETSPFNISNAFLRTQPLHAALGINTATGGNFLAGLNYNDKPFSLDFNLDFARGGGLFGFSVPSQICSVSTNTTTVIESIPSINESSRIPLASVALPSAVGVGDGGSRSKSGPHSTLDKINQIINDCLKKRSDQGVI